jgi:hypothetical protein
VSDPREEFFVLPAGRAKSLAKKALTESRFDARRKA